MLEDGMGGLKSRNKGKRGERGVIGLLLPVVIEVYEAAGMEPPELKRNTLQADRGGSDIAGLPWLAIEVKNQEANSLGAWWAQTVAQAKADQIPVLFYKRNNVAWRVKMFASLGGAATGITVAVTVDVADFLRWFRVRLTQQLASAMS
jgi:hypothetical protein